MNIYIARHAWAGDRDDSRWPDDSLRPLTASGRKRYSGFVKRLVKAGFKPARIATSPYLRCRQTAELLLENLPAGTKLEVLDAMGPDSILDAMVTWTNLKADEDVAWVGHTPDVGRLTAALIGGAGNIRFAKGGVAEVRFEGSAEAGSGALYWLATAKLLDC
jgi:phosphohistidine phosphatase